LLTESIIHKGYREDLPKLIPNLPPFRNRMIIDNDIYIDLSETNKIQEYFSQDIIKRASEAYDLIEKQSMKLIDTSKSLIKNSTKLSNEELSIRLAKFFKKYQKTIGAIGVPTIIDLTLEIKLKEHLKNSGIKNIEEALASLAISYKPVETAKEKEDLIYLAIKINKNKIKPNSKECNDLIDKHYNEYGWLHSTLFLGDLYDIDIIKDDLNKIMKIADFEKDKLQKERKEHIEEANKIIEKMKSYKGKDTAKFFQKAVYYRTARLEWMNKACFIIRLLLEDAAKRLDLDFYNIIYLMPEEIKEALTNKGVVKKLRNKIVEIHKGYAYISDNKEEYLLATGNELKIWKDKFSKEHKSDIVKGIVAYKGEAKGRAVIVRDRSELNKVNTGSILVTPLTTPDFVIAMKKSIGIVTDLGGVTSHAAITSRELKIPCIVGTGNATKIIKDGDLIELDTKKGTVKKL